MKNPEATTQTINQHLWQTFTLEETMRKQPKTIKSIYLAILAALVILFSACSQQPAPTEGLESQAAPAVLATSPVNGATGVAKNTNIRILFSKSMLKVATQASFSAVGAVSGVHAGVFSWNTNGTILTFNPTTDFNYGELVTVTVKKTATDVEGKAMPADYIFKFRIIRIKRVLLTSEPALDGHVFESGQVYTDNWLFVGDTNGTVPSGYPQPAIANQYARGFLSFDLSGLVADNAKQIVAAQLSVYQFDVNGNPYQEMGDLQAQGVVYGLSLEAADFATPVQRVFGATQTLATFAGTGLNDGYKLAKFTSKVQADLSSAATQHSRSQFRLKFNGDVSPNGTEDRASFYPGEQLEICQTDPAAHPCKKPLLYVVYTYP
jgi:hypothetical protein